MKNSFFFNYIYKTNSKKYKRKRVLLEFYIKSKEKPNKTVYIPVYIILLVHLAASAVAAKTRIAKRLRRLASVFSAAPIHTAIT